MNSSKITENTNNTLDLEHHLKLNYQTFFQITSPFDDVGSLPLEVTNNFKRALKNSNDHGGEAIPRAFLQSLAHLIGGYRDALKLRQVRYYICIFNA